MNEHRKRIHILVLAAKAGAIILTATALAACTTTAASQACHPSYAGRCVPIASDSTAPVVAATDRNMSEVPFVSSSVPTFTGSTVTAMAWPASGRRFRT